jgi:hypothetical protein
MSTRRQGTVLCLLSATIEIAGFLKGDREPSPVSLKLLVKVVYNGITLILRRRLKYECSSNYKK